MATLIEYAADAQVFSIMTYVQINEEIPLMDSRSTYYHSAKTEKLSTYVP